MQAQKFEKENPQAVIDHLLMKNIGELVHLTEQKKSQAQNKKDIVKLLLEQFGSPSSHIGRFHKRHFAQTIELYSLRLQKWIDTLKESFLYAKQAPFHWLSLASLTLLILYIGLGFVQVPFAKQESAQTIQQKQALKQKKERKIVSLTQKNGSHIQESIYPSKSSLKSTLERGSSSTVAVREGKPGELDNKEEELLLALETAQSEKEKQAILKKLKAHYIQKNENKETKEIQAKLEKLKNRHRIDH